MHDVIERETTDVAPVTGGSLIDVIARAAADQNTDVDKLERLMGLYQQIEAQRSEREFSAALAYAQSEMPIVTHDAVNTHTNSRYARLEAISKAANPIITKHGFALSFGTEDCPKQGHYRVTAKLTHNGGHSQTYQADIPADVAGAQGKANKNATQGFGSTMSYGRRYLKCMIFDIATGDDDDGLTATKAELPRISSERGKKYINFEAIVSDIRTATERQLKNLDAFVRDDCNWMPSGWQNKLLEMIGERGEELDNAEQAVVSANESLDRQFADTIGK